MDEYLKDLGKTVPSLDGKWDSRNEYERLSIVYIEEEGSDDDDTSGGGGGGNGSGDNGGGNNPNPNPNPDPDSTPTPTPTPGPTDEYVTIQISNNQGANITIDGENVSTKQVLVGTNHRIVLKKAGYYDKIINITNIQEDYVETVVFTEEDKRKYTITVNTNVPNYTLSILDENNVDIERIEAHQIEVDYGQSIRIGVNAYDGLYGRFQRIHNFTNITEDKVIEEIYNIADQDYVTDAHLTSVDGINWYYGQVIILPATLTNGQWKRIYVRNALNGDIWFKKLRDGDMRKDDNTDTDMEFRIGEENGKKYIEYKGTYVNNPSHMLTNGNYTIGYISPQIYDPHNSEEVAAYNEALTKYKNKYGVRTVSPASLAFLLALDTYPNQRLIIPC